jgi:non-specific serine/threonine protein kinase/serine/threonine-protein kinase
MNTADVMARFESERQAVALMKHPAIAKVFDAGLRTPCAGQAIAENVASPGQASRFR